MFGNVSWGHRSCMGDSRPFPFNETGIAMKHRTLTTSARYLATLATAATAFFALASTASAQGSADRATQTTESATTSTSLQDWRECADGIATGENIEPADESTIDAMRSGRLETGSGRATLDIDPTSDSVIVDFHDGVSEATIEEFEREHGLDLRLNSRYSAGPNLYVATVDEGAVPFLETCLTESDDRHLIEAIDENVMFSAFGETPNDPLYQFQWNFDQINVEQAWKTTAGDGVTVAVIDTGVAFDEDPSRDILRPKDLDGTEAVGGYDFVDDDEFAYDPHGHGTHVAGTIAQTTDNGYGVAGVAHGANIMPVRVLGRHGRGSIADIADAIRFASEHGADVINLSLGGPIPSWPLKSAVEDAHDNGTTVVAAAGNSGSPEKSYPAAYDDVIAVSATQYDKTKTPYSQWGDFVDIAAPGGNTNVDQNDDGRPDGVMQETLKNPGNTGEHDFVLYMGTSMASPHAAAGAALVHSQGVTNPDRIEEVLQKTADTSQRDRFDDPNEFDKRYGGGIMQVDQAVANANLEPGGVRFAGGLLLALLALLGVRRRDILGLGPKAGTGMLAAILVSSSGLFFLPALFCGGDPAGLVTALSHPVAELDLTLLGIGAHQNPLFASALLPLAAVGLLGTRSKWRGIVSGLALGTAAFCLTEAWLLTSDVQWIPGMAGLFDQLWLVANGLFSFALGYFGLKRY